MLQDTHGSKVLAQVREGMSVFDRNDEMIGTVEEVFLGAASEDKEARGQGAATAPDPGFREAETLVESFARALTDPGELPEELREHLLRRGYIKVDGEGLLAADKFVTPDHIDRVEDGLVMLNATRDELIKH